MSSAHLPSQVPAPSDYERGVRKGLELALALARTGMSWGEYIEALKELAE